MDSSFGLIDTWATALLLAGAMLAAWGAGWWLGRRQRAGRPDAPASKFDDASLALLGLLLAFTFSMSLGKHDQRRISLVTDSNAIGDFYTSASMLRDPLRTQLQTEIREYTELRLAVARQQPEAADLEAVLRRMQEMHGHMTGLVAEAVSAGTPIAAPLLNTLNGLTSSHAARLAALKDRLPSSIVLLLFLTAVVATAMVAREQGRSPRPQVTGALGFILVVALLVQVTLDLNQPGRGLITVSQEPIERLLASMAR